MEAKRLVAIGGSSGGLEAVRVIASGLPRDFPAAICVVLHMAADPPGMLEAILSRAGALPAIRAATGNLAAQAAETRRQAETVRQVATGRKGLTPAEPQAVGPRR